MSRLLHHFLRMLLLACCLVFGAGCDPQAEADPLVLKIGVIASLSGPNRVEGEVMVNSTRVIADYHNEQGGYLIGSDRYRIELLIRDDTSSPLRAASIASDFSGMGDIHYVIGPDGADLYEVVAPILDAAGIMYVYYGFSNSLLTGSDFGVLGMPSLAQIFDCVIDYLQELPEEGSIFVLAHESREALHTKIALESLAWEVGFDVVHISRFDVAEEVVDLSDEPPLILKRLLRVVKQAPDSVILCGFERGALSSVLYYLREAGYEGNVVARYPQDQNMVEQLGSLADDLLLVGWSAPIESRSEYYLALKERYLAVAEEWSPSVDLNLYALDSLLRGIAQIGTAAVHAPDLVVDSINSIAFIDPFFVIERQVDFEVDDEFSLAQQISVPIFISKFNEGKVEVVYRFD